MARKTSNHFLLLSSVDSQLQHVDRHQDRRKNVVQVVSNATGKRANRLHSLRAQKLRLHPLLFGDVSIDDEDRFGLSLLVTHQRPAALDHDLSAVSPHLMHFAFPLSVLNDCLARRIELRGTIFEKELFGVFANHFFSRPAVDFFGALVPEQNVLIEIAHENGILRLVQQRRLFANLLFSAFALGDVATNRDVLVGFSFSVEKRNDRRVYPVVSSVFGAISYLSAPNFSARDRGPQIPDELFRMVGRIDDAVILTQQLFARVFGDLAELVVDVIDDAALVGDRNDR